MLLGNIQIEALKHLKRSVSGLPIEQLLSFWRYRDGGLKSIAGLEQRGYIRIAKGRAYFIRFPPGVDLDNVSEGEVIQEINDFEEQTRRNLVYLYKEELERCEKENAPATTLPQGVRRSLKKLGVLKWKILELTELGRHILSEVLSPQFTNSSVSP